MIEPRSICADAVIHLADTLDRLNEMSDLPLYPPYSHTLERELRRANLEIVQRWLEFDKTPAHADRFMENVLLVVRRLRKLEEEVLKLPQAKWPSPDFTLGQLSGVEGQRLRWEFEHIRERARESAKYLRQLAWMIRSEGRADQGTKTQSKEQPWVDDATDYIMNSDAVKLAEFANRKLTLSALSKLLEPDGPIRYMRKRRPLRCKVHVGDFIAFMKTLPQIKVAPEELPDKAVEYITDTDSAALQTHIKQLKRAHD